MNTVIAATYQSFELLWARLVSHGYVALAVTVYHTWHAHHLLLQAMTHAVFPHQRSTGVRHEGLVLSTSHALLHEEEQRRMLGSPGVVSGVLQHDLRAWSWVLHKKSACR